MSDFPTQLDAIADALDADTTSNDATVAEWRAAFDALHNPFTDLSQQIAAIRYAAGVVDAFTDAVQIAVDAAPGLLGIQTTRISTYEAQIASASAAIEDLQSGAVVAARIASNRAALVAARHHVETWGYPSGTATDLTAERQAFIRGITNGTVSAPRTIHLRPGTFRINDTINVTKNYTTIDGHGTVCVVQPNVTVTGVVCNGTITATRTGAAAFPSTIRVGMSFQMRATDDADYSTNKFRGMVKTISNDRKTITFTKAHTSRTGTGTFVNNPGTPSGSRNTNGTRHWYLNGCNHVTFKNMEITGAVSASETAVGDLGQQYPWPVYYGDLEGQHPIEIAGGTYVEVAGCELHEGYGDGVYLGGQTDHAWIHDNNIYRMAREAVSPIGATNTLVEGNHFHQITHNKMDCEPTSGYVDGLIVRGNIMGSSGYAGWVSAGTGKRVDNVTIEDNVGEADPNVGVGGEWSSGAYGAFGMTIGTPSVTSYKQNWIVRNNTAKKGATLGGSGPRSYAVGYRVNNFTFTGNNFPMPLSGGVKNAVGVIGYNFTGTISVSGNTETNSYQGAQAVINGTNYPIPVTATVAQGYTVPDNASGTSWPNADTFRNTLRTISGNPTLAEASLRQFGGPQFRTTASLAPVNYSNTLTPRRHNAVNLNFHKDNTAFPAASEHARCLAIAAGTYDSVIVTWANNWNAKLAGDPLGSGDVSLIAEVDQGWTGNTASLSGKTEDSSMTFDDYIAAATRIINVTRNVSGGAPNITFVQVWAQSGTATTFPSALVKLTIPGVTKLGLDWYAAPSKANAGVTSAMRAIQLSGMAGDTIHLPLFEAHATKLGFDKCMPEWGCASRSTVSPDLGADTATFITQSAAYQLAHGYTDCQFFQADASPGGLGNDVISSPQALAAFAAIL